MCRPGPLRFAAYAAYTRPIGRAATVSTTHVTGATLQGVPLLAGASEEALADLAADARPFRVLAGDWLLREGDEADDLYVVVRGRLRVVARSGGEERTLRVLGPGASIGELALLTGAPRSASVQAVRDSTLLRLPRGPFVELLERDHVVRGGRRAGARAPAPGERRPRRTADPPRADRRPRAGDARAGPRGRPVARARAGAVRLGRGARRVRGGHGSGRARRGRARPRPARRRDRERRVERPLRTPGRIGCCSSRPRRARCPRRRRPSVDLVVLGPSAGRDASRAARRRRPACAPSAGDDGADRPGDRQARASDRRSRAGHRALGRRRARLRAHRRAGRARARRHRGRPLRRLLDGLVHRRDGGRRLAHRTTSATAATRSSSAARRSTTTRSRGSR